MPRKIAGGLMVAMRSFAERLADENLGLLVVILIAFEDEILWINFGADAEGDTGRVGPLFDNHVHKKLLELSGGQLRRSRGNEHHPRVCTKVPHADPVTPQHRQGGWHDCGYRRVVFDLDRDGDLASEGPNALN